MPGRNFCGKCGGAVRSPTHVCQPNRISKHQKIIIPLKKRIEKGQ